MRLPAVLAVAAAAVAVAAFSGIAQPHPAAAVEPERVQTVSVTGTGSLTTVPDRASFDLTVESRARTAAAALAQVAEGARGVIDAVKNAGVAERDVRTAIVSLTPVTTENGASIAGYAAATSVSVVVRDLDRAGRVVDAAVGAGATGVSGPSLERVDVDELYRRALGAAVEDARAKATALADAAGRRLGVVVTLVEGGGVPVPVTERTAAPADVPIEPGTQQVQASVTVTFALG